MSEDELKAIESVARNPKWIDATDAWLPANDVHRLVSEVRRLQASLGEAVAANLCHVPIQRMMGDDTCRNCGGPCTPIPICARCCE